ncbi:DUF3006 domain-containing protein [Ruminococcaceae bacterium OttesenSCG-928-L11]|nr:DUF3006 domain-containing protein [Ruminococcaceae bacterium OttesenSCG-928-L11]
MGHITVDRIENDIAACEMPDRTMRMLPLSLLPEGTAEGDVLYERGGRYVIDRAETAARREHNRRLMERLRAGTEADNPSD